MFLLPGQARAKVPAMFADVWETYVEVPYNKPPEFKIRTRADTKVADLKTALPLCPTFDTSYDIIAEALKLAGF